MTKSFLASSGTSFRLDGWNRRVRWSHLRKITENVNEEHLYRSNREERNKNCRNRPIRHKLLCVWARSVTKCRGLSELLLLVRTRLGIIRCQNNEFARIESLFFSTSFLTFMHVLVALANKFWRCDIELRTILRHYFCGRGQFFHKLLFHLWDCAESPEFDRALLKETLACPENNGEIAP